MRGGTVILAVSIVLATCTIARAAEPQDPSAPQASPKSRPLRLTFYPLLVRLPIFNASLELPETDGGGGESGPQSGSTDWAFQAAYMAGFEIESSRWFAEITGLWAALSASHPTPLVSVDSDLYFFNARGGIKMFRNLSGTVGVRRVSVGLDATLTPVVMPTSSTIHGSVKPGLWDPLVGLDWRADVGRKWSVDALFQGGGFGVGTDVDLEGDLYGNWHAARHFDVRFGYTLIHFKMTVPNVVIGDLQRTLVARQTLHGPTLGFGLVF